MKTLTDEILRKLIKERPRQSHKGDYGRLLIIAGNEEYGGAGILAASAGVYSGAGLVTLVTAEKNHTSLHARLPEAMVLDFSALTSDLIQSADVILIGPGLGLERPDLLGRVLDEQKEEQWLVIDGSAISLFQAGLKHPDKTVFTPHQKEMERLSGLTIAEQTPEGLQAFADELGAGLVAKSEATKIFFPDMEASLLTLGTPAQATGGMGDTLAGMIAGFLAQFPQKEAVLAATYLHSKIASDLAEEAYVVLPSQIIEKIPQYMKRASLQNG
ncbi:NAD(P)H-hydrate dehydratase [Lactococcus termiticola]|nr:NAD(P)H-hydrate dehydratase [Lactococcus termiticola]